MVNKPTVIQFYLYFMFTIKNDSIVLKVDNFQCCLQKDILVKVTTIYNRRSN